MQVFIENAAGAREKNTFDERSLQHLKTAPISAAYPFPYGFVLGTVSGDGDAVDCFVLTDRPLASGATVACIAVGLLEQVEDGETDHKVIAVPEGEPEAVTPPQEAALRAFAGAVFAHVPGKTMTVGRLLGREAAQDYVRQCRTPAPR